MQKHFSAGSGTYYSDSIFFLSVAMHQIMPKGNLDGQEQWPWGVRLSMHFWAQYSWCPVSKGGRVSGASIEPGAALSACLIS